jgi:uncharacterized protein (TIGR02757 family)
MAKTLSLVKLKNLLDEQYELHNTPEFIESDPIQIPHRFTKREDIEIASFLTSQIAWGKRRMIINNASRLMDCMGNRPHEFVTGASARELRSLECFVHRTFNAEDCATAVLCLRNLYTRHGGLKGVFERAFAETGDIRGTLIRFRETYLETDHAPRFRKHVSDVARKSAAKRLNLFLMWMCRSDGRGVHFGLWNIPPHALMIPLDVHVGNVGRSLGLLARKQNDWSAVEQITAALRRFDPADPVKYDFALFGMGVLGKVPSA